MVITPLFFLAYPQECHEEDADRLVADAHTVVGVVESAYRSRMEENKQG